jgi:hypothetical protein
MVAENLAPKRRVDDKPEPWWLKTDSKAEVSIPPVSTTDLGTKRIVPKNFWQKSEGGTEISAFWYESV